MMKFLRLLLLVAPVFIFSCKPQQKIPNYLQTVSDSAINSNVLIPELLIQANDLLSIQIYSASTLPSLSDAPYNLPSSSGASEGGTGGASGGGYLVDVRGNIEYPRIGTITAAGLTKQQLADVIKRRVNEKETVLTNPSVIIRFQNLRFTVLGEVGSQGAITVPSERVTILQAIGLAGGITEFGQRAAVKVLREINGKRQLGLVDLSSNKLFESPYYNLMQNDVVIVDQSAIKAKKTQQELVVSRVSLGLSLLTAIVLVYSIFRK